MSAGKPNPARHAGSAAGQTAGQTAGQSAEQSAEPSRGAAAHRVVEHPPFPSRLRPPRVVSPAASQLLAMARRGLDEAATSSRPAERYACAHLAALRAAAAVLAARARPETPGGRGRRPRNAWALLIEVAPEMAEWAAFFAAGAAKRAAAEAGIPGVVSARDADDLLRDTELFLSLAQTTLGVAHQPSLAFRVRAS